MYHELFDRMFARTVPLQLETSHAEVLETPTTPYARIKVEASATSKFEVILIVACMMFIPSLMNGYSFCLY